MGEYQWNDRIKKIERIVLPMVVFVRLDQYEEDVFCRLSFILRLRTYPDSAELATPIPDEQLEKLKFFLLNKDAKVLIVKHHKVGDNVRLAKGPMKGLDGELSHSEENKPNVAIRIDGLGCACANVEKVNLEVI